MKISKKLSAGLMILFYLGQTGLFAQTDPGASVLPKQNAFKIALFSLSIGKIDVGYERMIKNGISWELRGGYSFENDVLYNPAYGGFTKTGLKFILPFKPGEESLAGFYIRPELSFGVVSMKNGCKEIYTGEWHRTNRWSMAVMVSGGAQIIIKEIFLLDFYAGIGSGSSFKVSDPTGIIEDAPCVNRGWERYLGHSLLTNGFPIALTTGVSIGVVF